MEFLDKVIDVPVAVQRHVPMVFDAVQFLDKVIDVPVAVQRHVPMVVLTVQFFEKVIDVRARCSATTRVHGVRDSAVLGQGC